MDTTPLDIGDFFEDPNGKIDHLIGDGTVKNYFVLVIKSYV